MWLGSVSGGCETILLLRELLYRSCVGAARRFKKEQVCVMLSGRSGLHDRPVACECAGSRVALVHVRSRMTMCFACLATPPPALVLKHINPSKARQNCGNFAAHSSQTFHHMNQIIFILPLSPISELNRPADKRAENRAAFYERPIRAPHRSAL